MNQTPSIIMSILVVALATSCKDIVEPNLKNSSVAIKTPADGYQSPGNSITFWWDAVEDATKYHLQVVSPSFSNVQILALDTNISQNTFTYSFAPGNYEWRVRARNNSSATVFYTYSFSIDSTLNLTTSKVNLVSPTANYYSNTNKQLFKWALLTNANEYRFEIYDSSGVSSVYTKTLLTGDTTSYTFTIDGVYRWRVKAQNNNSITTNYNERFITIDHANPDKPVLTSPIYNDTTSSPAKLKWTRGSTDVSADSVIIANDSLFTTGKTGAYVTTASSTQTYSYSFSGASGTKYFWKVRSKDVTGNWGSYSDLGKFRAK